MASDSSADPLKGTVVAHILPFTGVGGTEHGTLRIMKAVEPFGIKNIAISLHRVPAIRAFFGDAGFPVIEWPAPEPSIRHGGGFWAASRTLAREFKRLGVSLVHCSDYLGAFHTSLAGRMAGVPVLCHIRNRYSDLSFRDRIFLYPVTKFAFVSKDTWDRFAHKVGPAKGTVLYDGLNAPDGATVAAGLHAAPGLKSEFGLPPSTRLIGMIARVAPQKDYDTLIRAAALVVAAHPEVRFLIIGDNSLTDAARDHYRYVSGLLSKAGLSDYFLFTGYRTDTFRLLASLDLAVLSTHHEGLPLALIETMAYAKATVATAVDGVPELISDGENGFLCPHEDPECLAEKLLLLLDNPQLAKQLGNAARETVLTTFTAEKFTQSVCTLYSQLLSA
jgi:glycosyltransferase involved in cell wall biosynthesis